MNTKPSVKPLPTVSTSDHFTLGIKNHRTGAAPQVGGCQDSNLKPNPIKNSLLFSSAVTEGGATAQGKNTNEKNSFKRADVAELVTPL